MTRLVIAACVIAAAFAAPPAQAKTVRAFWQQSALVPARVFDHIGFIPIVGIQPEGAPPQTVKAGSTTYKVTWINALVSRTTTTQALREMQRSGRYPPVLSGLFADRRLTSAEKRRFQVLLDIGRDADVLVVHRDNPACVSGLSRAQARGIARGTITRWSQVSPPAPGQPDAIVRRVIGDREFAQPRFGVPLKPGRAYVKPDGGVSQVLAGDRSVAAVTAWSRVRRDSRLCAVAIDGVAPSEASVHALSYGEAYPITFVMHRKRRRDREGRAMIRAYVDFLRSEKAADLFRRAGLLLARDAPAAGPQTAAGAAPGPGQDHQGRPITTTRDDDAVRAALTGVRLERDQQRFAFDPDRVLYEIGMAPDGQSCTRVQGQWDVLEGWRYSEHGGGVIARVRLTLATTREVTIELSGDSPGIGYVDGQPHTSDPSLSSTCG